MRLRSILDFWDRFEQHVIEKLALLMLIVSLIVMMFEALLRIFLSHSFSWSSEIVVYSMIWAIYLNMASAGKRRKHIRTEVLFNYLPESIRYWLRRLTEFFGLIFGLVLTFSAWQMVRHMLRTGRVSESTLEIPIWLIGLAVLSGAVLFSIYKIESAFFARHLGFSGDHEDPHINSEASADSGDMQGGKKGISS